MALLAFAGVAEARKRVVVLDFSGPKADQFQAQVTGVIKRSHSVVSTAKWNDAADELGVKMNAKGLAKIAAKINVDGIVVGSVDRRGTRYFVHVKLKSGATGEQVAEVELVARSGKLSSSDLDEVKEQIVGAIDQLDAPSGDDDADDEPVAKGKDKSKGKHKLDDSDDAADDSHDRHKGFRGHGKDSDDGMAADDDASSDDDGDAPRSKSKGKDKGKAKGKGKHVASADDDDAGAASDDSGDDDAPKAKSKAKGKGKDKGKGKGKGKDTEDDSADTDTDKGTDTDTDKDDDRDRVATRDKDRDDGASSDDDEAVGAEGELERNPQHLPLDALAGLSFTGRRLTFTTSPGLTNKPQGYRSGVPVTGVFIDADLYPLAFNAKNRSITRDFGITVMFDRVLSISSQLDYKDMTGANQTASLGTTEQHLAFGVIFRHALGKQGPMDPTVFASIRYNRSKFVIDKAAAPMGVTVDIPNTDYTYVDPGVGLRYPLSPKLALDGGVRFDLITNTGEMQQPDQYGAATVYGFDLDAGGDYTLNQQWFVHAGLHLSTIGFSFKGTGALTTMRDNDPNTIDVQGARDTYYGAMVTAGYLY